MLVLLIFYSLISGPPYFLKELGELCNDNELITNLTECKSAVSELKNTGMEIRFESTTGISCYPKGCILFKGISNKLTKAYWNTPVSGSANSEIRPICKKINM